MKQISIVAMLFAGLSLSGCIGLAIGAGGEAASVVAQERTVGTAVDDAGIQLRIKHAFAVADANDLLPNVESKVVEGRVLLSGNVDKPESQIEAVRLVWEIDNVKEVINEIQVNDQTGIWNYTKDAWISNQIRVRLFATKGIRSVNYSVLTVNQTVYLMGIAQDQLELDKVSYIASTTSYVNRVVSYVRLKDDTRRG